jgi:hypothetical protein
VTEHHACEYAFVRVSTQVSQQIPPPPPFPGVCGRKGPDERPRMGVNRWIGQEWGVKRWGVCVGRGCRRGGIDRFWNGRGVWGRMFTLLLLRRETFSGTKYIENGWDEDLRKINTPYCSLKVMTRYECHIISSTIGTPSMRYIYMQQ